jgi:hypothetical protein
VFENNSQHRFVTQKAIEVLTGSEAAGRKGCRLVTVSAAHRR